MVDDGLVCTYSHSYSGQALQDDGGTMDGETRLCEVKHVSAWLPNSNVQHLIMGTDKGTPNWA